MFGLSVSGLSQAVFQFYSRLTKLKEDKANAYAIFVFQFYSRLTQNVRVKATLDEVYLSIL